MYRQSPAQRREKQMISGDLLDIGDTASDGEELPVIQRRLGPPNALVIRQTEAA